MAGIIEKYAKKPITVRIVSGISDGKNVYTNYAGVAMMFSPSKAVMDSHGTVRSARTFLIAPMQPAPEIPGEIVCDGETYTIQEAKPINNLKGVLLGYRVVTAGA